MPIVKDTTKTEHTRQERIIVNRKYAQRTPNTGLCVFRKDGSHIQAYTAAETFVQAIREAGARNVMDMNISVDKNNLILKHTHYSAPIQLHLVEPGYYVNVHSNSAAKKRYLERNSDELKLGWKIKIVD